MTIYPLSEGTFTIGHDKVFHPFHEAKDILTDRATGSLLVEIQPFLIKTTKDLIVLDTGLGFRNEEGVLQIHSNIRALGFDPEAVTKVLLTHLHKDHSGGAIHTNANGQINATFPNAQYFVYRPEAAFALEKGAPSYVPADVESILKLENITWLDGEAGDIEGYIHYTHSGGHCPEHIVYLVEENGEKIFFGGDEAPQYKQIKTRYIAKYDYDGRKAAELRNQYATRGRAEDWTLLFYHDTKLPFSKINF